jgi:hypothetical protein
MKTCTHITVLAEFVNIMITFFVVILSVFWGEIF